MIEQGSATQIVYGATGGKLALMNGQALRKAFVPLPGGATAVYISTGLSYYRHTDWLGSGRLATTTTRTMLWDVAYAPYGETYVSSGTIDPNFTGQNQDTVSNIYDFLFREYNAPHGRWPWPDPAGLGAVSLDDPQTWNRYAYVRNGPLNSVDPLGLFKSDARGSVDDMSCVETYSCTTFVDQFGTQLNSAFAKELLRLDAAVAGHFVVVDWYRSNGDGKGIPIIDFDEDVSTHTWCASNSGRPATRTLLTRDGGQVRLQF